MIEEALEVIEVLLEETLLEEENLFLILSKLLTLHLSMFITTLGGKFAI